MLTAIIVEDEKHSREMLKSLVADYCPEVELLHAAASIDEALPLISKEKPELLFLDIELQSGTSFDLLQQLEERNFEVIFTTAFEQYAIRAIKFSSLDYLLKPIDPEELMASVQKALNKKNATGGHNRLEVLLSNLTRPAADDAKICLATSDSMEFLQVKDILYCEANGSYTNFYIRAMGGQNREITVSKHLKEYENLLVDHPFMRVHNKYLINLKAVQKFVKSEGGYILMTDEKQIPISPNKRDVFFRSMAELL